jgi:hypothetical protein
LGFSSLVASLLGGWQQIGGTMAGDFTPGLSGGQRKMLLFEIVKQRTAAASDLLIVLDEPFAGVTDDFLPFITAQLNAMRQKHNILIVTNDHVAALTALADNTLTVSALDRTRVSVRLLRTPQNKRLEIMGVLSIELQARICALRLQQVNGTTYDRELSLYALASGKDFYASRATDKSDLWFFVDVELLSNGALGGVAGFTVFALTLFVLRCAGFFAPPAVLGLGLCAAVARRF